MALIQFEDLPSTNTPINANNLNNNFQHFGKLLWEGNFTSGTINVPNLDNYGFIVMIANTVPMYGSKYFGIGGFLGYEGTNINTISYRLNYSNNTLTIDTVNKGCYDNLGQQQAITQIYGLF